MGRDIDVIGQKKHIFHKWVHIDLVENANRQKHLQSLMVLHLSTLIDFIRHLGCFLASDFGYGARSIPTMTSALE